MSRFRRIPTHRLVTTAAVALAIVAAVPLAQAADEPRPVVTMSVGVSAKGPRIPNGTPLAMTLDWRFKSVPAGGNFVLERIDYLFGRGARLNGSRFPSCRAAKLRAARGNPAACPRGSKIGEGRAWGTAVAIGLRSSGTLSLYNGPGGRSVTMHLRVVNPAQIEETISIPIVKTSGRYAFKTSVSTPPKLQTILDGPIVVSRILLTIGVTRTIGGVKTPYFEANNCPREGSPLHGDYFFVGGATASTDVTAVC